MELLRHQLRPMNYLVHKNRLPILETGDQISADQLNAIMEEHMVPPDVGHVVAPIVPCLGINTGQYCDHLPPCIGLSEVIRVVPAAHCRGKKKSAKITTQNNV